MQREGDTERVRDMQRGGDTERDTGGEIQSKKRERVRGRQREGETERGRDREREIQREGDTERYRVRDWRADVCIWFEQKKKTQRGQSGVQLSI